MFSNVIILIALKIHSNETNHLDGHTRATILVLLLHSRAIWQGNEYQKVLIFIALPHDFKEMPITFLDIHLSFHIFTFTTIPCPMQQ